MDVLGRLKEKLHLIHDPRTPSALRKEAHNRFPEWGFQLAKSDEKHESYARHFGLSLLQHAIQYNYSDYAPSQRAQILQWIVDLSFMVTDEDPHFIREKIAFLWASLCKRTWGILPSETPNSSAWSSNENTDLINDRRLEWADMDSSLLSLWQQNMASRQLTLSIFKTLFEDVFYLDDLIAAKRGSALTMQCIDVLISENVLSKVYDKLSEDLIKLRADSEGWLKKWSDALRDVLTVPRNDSRFPACERMAGKILETVKTCLTWVFPLAVQETHLLENLSMALTNPSIDVRTRAAECLHSLFTRNFSSEEDFQAIVGPVFQQSGIVVLSDVYDAALDDDSEAGYVFMKKLVELIVGLGEFMIEREPKLPDTADLAFFLQLVLKTTMNPHLVVSGLSLQFWTALLRSDKRACTHKELAALLPHLLEVACERSLKYEDLGDKHHIIQELETDFGTSHDIYNFLNSYEHFMQDVVRLTVCVLPVESMLWLKTRMQNFFASECNWKNLEAPFTVYKGNPAYFLAYSQFAIVESALKGVSRWSIWYNGTDKTSLLRELSLIISEWGQQLSQIKIVDPLLGKRIVQSLVQFAPHLKDSSMASNSQIMLQVLERVLEACTAECPEKDNDEMMERYRDLRTSSGTELNRLAYMIPDSLMQIYDDLQRVIDGITQSSKLSCHELVAFHSFLLVVSQRSNSPLAVREACFARIVDPIIASWNLEENMRGLADLSWFMERLGIVKIAEYFHQRGVTEKTDLLCTPMDAAGRALKQQLRDQWSALFPIRATRVFAQYTIEGLDTSSSHYQDLLRLWKPRLQPIVRHILQLAARIQAYHNPSNWSDLPSQVKTFVKDSCTERFWQVGVSIQTRDQFIDENTHAMQTLRDFADSLGHIVRYTREYVFLTLGTLTQLQETLYEIPGIAHDLWTALAQESKGITLHSWRHLISLVLRNVVKNCPREYMEPFLKEFLPLVLEGLDRVLTEKWAIVNSRGILLTGTEGDDDKLSSEMMEEHLLRQLTGIVDRFLIDLAGQSTSKNKPSYTQSVVIHNKEILAPFLVLCDHIMLFRDSRCSFNTCLVMRMILPQILALNDDDIDDFLLNKTLKSCLDILNEPYYCEVHHEAGYIITSIYTTLRDRSSKPATTLTSIMPGLNPKDISELESRLAQSRSLRQQRGLFLEFLSLVRLMQNGDEEGLREEQKKRMQKKTSNWVLTSKSREDLIEEGGMESSLANLFGEK